MAITIIIKALITATTTATTDIMDTMDIMGITAITATMGTMEEVTMEEAIMEVFDDNLISLTSFLHTLSNLEHHSKSKSFVHFHDDLLKATTFL